MPISISIPQLTNDLFKIFKHHFLTKFSFSIWCFISCFWFYFRVLTYLNMSWFPKQNDGSLGPDCYEASGFDEA